MLITINYQFIYSKNPLKVLKVIDKEKSDTNKKYSIQIEKSDFFILKNPDFFPTLGPKSEWKTDQHYY